MGVSLFTYAAFALVALLAPAPSSASRCFLNFSPDKYPSCAQLSPNISLHWAVRNGSISWAVDVDGAWDWVGIGISEGGMLGADIAIAAHDAQGQQWTASDYWSTDFIFPQLDQQQDVTLVSVVRQSSGNINGNTLIVMMRPLVTCDWQDKPVLYDTRQTVVYAYGTGPLGYHGTSNRGQYDLVFAPNTTASGAGTFPSDVQTLDLRMTPGFVVPSSPTTYQCVNLALPNATKYHLYRHQPLIDNTPLVHHFVAYACRGGTPPPTPLGVPYDCLQHMECEEFYLGWAPGVDAVDAPAQAALPFGAGTGILYVSLQIHYTNLAGVTGQTDSSGFRLTYSPTLKPYDMGVLTLGSFDISVPPGVASWSTAPNVCPAACTTKLAARSAAGGVTLVESFYHMHQLGRNMVTQHVRGGVELPPLGSRDYFGFEYQAPVSIPPGARQLLPGDLLITTCNYTGVERTDITKFGPASYDEMCFNFLTYYPYNPDVSECIGIAKTGLATCTASDVLDGLKNDSDWQAAAKAGQMVPLPANVTYRPYQPTCVRTAPSNSGGGGGAIPGGNDEGDEANSDDSSPSAHHTRNVGGAVAAILIVTAVGAAAIVWVLKAMKKKQQAEEEKHLFEKYNPNSVALPVVSSSAAVFASEAVISTAGASAAGPSAAIRSGNDNLAVGSSVGGGNALGKGYTAVPSEISAA